MSTAPIAFSGLSTYSSDFQAILSRAVSISQIPLTQLQNHQSDNNQKQQLLTGFSTSIAALGASIASLGSIGANKALLASSSDSAVLVSNTGAAQAATYTISNVTSLATAASETSGVGYADTTAAPVSASGTLSLVLGTAPAIPIVLGAGKNNLTGLRDAINSSGAAVTASILTTGTGLTPNYLVITSTATGATTLKLNDSPSGSNLLTSANQGTNAVFNLNNIPINRTTNSVNDVVSGLTFTLLKVPTANVTLSLSPDRTQLSNTLSDLTTKYNAIADQVNAQMGANAGLLSGDFLVHTITDDLRQLTGYQGSGSTSLAALGITFNNSGKMSYDPTSLNAMSDSQFSSALTFLGSSTTGFGAFATKFNQLSDPISGLIKIEQNGFDTSNKNLTSQINTLSIRISSVQSALTLRLEKADAAASKLQGQQSILTASLQSVNLALFGKNTAQ